MKYTENEAIQMAEYEAERLLVRIKELRSEKAQIAAMAPMEIHQIQGGVYRTEFELRRYCQWLIKRISYNLAPNALRELSAWFAAEAEEEASPEERLINSLVKDEQDEPAPEC